MTHWYNADLCIRNGLCILWSTGRYIGRSICPSVCHHLLENLFNYGKISNRLSSFKWIESHNVSYWDFQELSNSHTLFNISLISSQNFIQNTKIRFPILPWFLLSLLRLVGQTDEKNGLGTADFDYRCVWCIPNILGEKKICSLSQQLSTVCFFSNATKHENLASLKLIATGWKIHELKILIVEILDPK